MFEMLMSMPKRETFVIWNHFWEGYTLEELAWYMGVSKQRVGQIKNRAIRRMQQKVIQAGGVIHKENRYRLKDSNVLRPERTPNAHSKEKEMSSMRLQLS